RSAEVPLSKAPSPHTAPRAPVMAAHCSPRVMVKCRGQISLCAVFTVCCCDNQVLRSRLWTICCPCGIWLQVQGPGGLWGRGAVYPHWPLYCLHALPRPLSRGCL
uniref:Uncharacterized protein n=1 Tax=Denticeps clupeoides TaxID=299321 RepID=A0AAY4C1R5_9TELE